MSDSVEIDNGTIEGLHSRQLEPPTLMFHESAHSIVFRDQIRRQTSYDRGYVSQQTLERKHHILTNADRMRSLSIGSSQSSRQWNENRKGDETPSDTGSVSSGFGTLNDSGLIHLPSNEPDCTPTFIIANITPHIEPLEPLPLSATDEFQPLFTSNPVSRNYDNEIEQELWDADLSYAEREVVMKLQKEQCVVKSIRVQEWAEFLQRFKKVDLNNTTPKMDGSNLPFNSFKTSTTLLPSRGVKMRCYGSSREYSHGVVFALPGTFPGHKGADDAAKEARVWCWPSGFSAKTEFNIDHYGNLMNGREEALVTLDHLRQMNHSFINDTDYAIAGKLIKGGLNTVPYNEVYVRVGGVGGEINRSFAVGLGLPIALFTRSATYGDLIGLLRVRSRMGAILGKASIQAIPLLMITPESGVKVLTDKLQTDLLRIMSSELNPFQNPLLEYKTSIDNSSEQHLQEKRDELFNLDDDNIRSVLTAEECARLAGGFGATDESVVHLLMNAMLLDSADEKLQRSTTDELMNKNRLQDLVNEGLCSAVRSGDYNTARQLLILYSLVASKGEKENTNHAYGEDATSQQRRIMKGTIIRPLPSIPTMVNVHSFPTNHSLSPPPPPPLDTDRLRFATNSDGLLAVLGAAEILRSIRDGVVKRRAEEVVQALEEWLDKSDSITFRLQSWRNQKAAQGERKIATEQESNLMAFISSKAINNRKLFIDQLRAAIDAANFQSISFLKSLHTLVTGLHSPCLRLELLQFILALDNRFSIAHVARSLELAATCLSVSLSESRTLDRLSNETKEAVPFS